MTFSVRVVPNAKSERLVREAGRLKVYLCAPAIEGKANGRLVDFLAESFGVKRRQVVIRRGLASRDKLVEILGP